MQKIDSVSELASRYPVWFCDVWGVLHDGVCKHPPAVAALQNIRAAGGCVVLLTNAPRPARFVEERLAELGVDNTTYDAVVTSGDVTLALLAKAETERVLYIGPDRDIASLGAVQQKFVESAQADCILAVGLIDDEAEEPEDYRSYLSGLAQRGLPFYCANPDRVVQRGARLVPCAGALADIYEELGGTVIMAGKPFAPIYERAFETAGQIRGVRPPPDLVLAVGDGLPTDMAGAALQGLDALFILDGIHAEEFGVHADDIDDAAVEKISRALAGRVKDLVCVAVMQMLR